MFGILKVGVVAVGIYSGSSDKRFGICLGIFGIFRIFEHFVIF